MKKRKLLTLIGSTCLVLVIAASLLMAACAPAAEEVIELKISHWIPGATEFSQTIFDPVVDYINENGGGKIHATLYAGGALGGSGEQYEMVKEGIAEIAYLVPTFEPGVWPLSEMMGMALTFPNNKLAAEAALATYDRILHEEFTDIISFGVYRTGDMYLNLTDKKVTSLDDLQGLRIRSTGGMTTVALEALGAVPVPMPPPDMYLAMQTGVVDGAVNTLSFMETYKMSEVTKYTAVFGLGTGVCAFIMNIETWNKLDKDSQRVVTEALKLGTKLNYEYPDNIAERSIQKMKATGEYYELSPAEYQRWYDAIRPAYHKWAADLDAKGKKGTQTLDIFREETEKRGFNFPY